METLDQCHRHACLPASHTSVLFAVQLQGRLNLHPCARSRIPHADSTLHLGV